MTELSSTQSKFWTLSLLFTALFNLSCASSQSAEEFGPFKPPAIKTPFSLTETDKSSPSEVDALNPIALSSNQPLGRRHLGRRIIQARLYLPDKMVLGRVSEFTVKANPGWWVALAMADKDSGSKPILGHALKLGVDHKVVAVAKIPANGVATLLVECPIEGDLVGQHLFFEAAIWSDPDMHDTEIVQCVPNEGNIASNAVLIQPQFEQKKGVRIIPTSMPPSVQAAQQQQGLSQPHP